MQIKDLAIGDGFVYLMEGSTKVKFYVLAHNYESGLNGNGRTLFCRESPPTSGYTLTEVNVKMGSEDVTGSAWNAGEGCVSIGSVSGNIVITAVAEVKKDE